MVSPRDMTMRPCRKSSSYRIQTVETALSILEAISEQKGDVCLAQLSRQLKVNKSKIFRFLTTLEYRGYLEPSESQGQYRIGATAVSTSRKLLMRMDLLSVAKPEMELLCRQCNEDIYLAVPSNNEMLLLDPVFSTQKVHVLPLIGKSYCMEDISAGRIVLAYRKGNSETSESRYIQEQGGDSDHGAIGEGISTLAAPIFNARKEVVGCLCLIGPTYRIHKQRIHDKLFKRIVSAGQIITAKLG